MNGRQAKRIRKLAKLELVDWLRGQLGKEDQSSITIDTILSKLSTQTHFLLQGKYTVAPYSFRWAIKQIKKNERRKRSS
jgi:hypothetical protein